MNTKLDRTKFSHIDITTSGQYVTLSAVQNTSPAFPVPARYRIQHDTSHVAQSYAVAEVWSAMSLTWNEAATYAAGLWAKDSGSAYDRTRGDHNPTKGIEGALAVLQLRVRRLIDPQLTK